MVLSSGTFTLQPCKSFFLNFSLEVEKCIMWGSVQVLPHQVSKKSFCTFEDIDLQEFHAKLHEKASGTLELIQFKCYKSISTVFMGALTDFRCNFHKVRLQKREVHLLSSKTSP